MATAKAIQAPPPLSKSRRADLACESLYQAKHIQGIRTESDASLRGSEIHDVLKKYVDHLVASRLRRDLGYIESLCKGASEEVREVLDTVQEKYSFDPDSIVGTEIHICLDADFEPCQRKQASYEGTLDLVVLLNESTAEVHDYKSYFQIVDAANSFESKMYCLLLMCANPAINIVRFALDFVRYGASRDVSYSRADLPALKKIAAEERQRQLTLHEKESFRASPGKHCAWCPILFDCPLGKRNPYANMTPDQRLMQTVWLKEAYEASAAVLKDFVVESGPVECRDDNGGLLRAEFRAKELRSYPLGEASVAIGRWVTEHPDDDAFVANLTIGGLSSPLKAKKRAGLAEKLASVADVRSQTEFKVGHPKDEE